MTTHTVEQIKQQHPCFSARACRWFGRVHLAVARNCNIQCRYCTRRYDCANENRPGVTSELLTLPKAREVLIAALAKEPRINAVGVAGPGDPLADGQTLVETFRMVNEINPDLIKCFSTNGLNLADWLPALTRVGVDAVTVTVNAVNPAVGQKIYSRVTIGEETLRGAEAAELLWQRQKLGLGMAVGLGLAVKVNSVLIPGINHEELSLVAKEVKQLGVHMMNVIPLIPLAGFKNRQAPTTVELREHRRELEKFLPQMKHCRQCRADAVGML